MIVTVKAKTRLSNFNPCCKNTSSFIICIVVDPKAPKAHSKYNIRNTRFKIEDLKFNI